MLLLQTCTKGFPNLRKLHNIPFITNNIDLLQQLELQIMNQDVVQIQVLFLFLDMENA